MWILKTNPQGEIPNCGHALDIHESWSRVRDISPELETIALEGASLMERETIPIFEEEPWRSGKPIARAYQLCSPSP